MFRATICSIRLIALVPLAFTAFLASPALAQGWIEIERPVDPGAPTGEVSRTSSQVRIAVDGRVARVEIEERFRNSGGRLAEGCYLYPMPMEAVFTNFSLWMGDQEVRGETMNADQARTIYEEIVRRRRDPALLTFAGLGLVRARIFPIGPGETRKVVLRYTQLLPRAGDALRLRYSLGKRGSGGNLSFVVTATGAAGYGTPYSPTHAISTRQQGDRLEITFPSDAAGEVELFLPLRQGLVGTSLVTHAPGGEDGYFMLLLAPPHCPFRGGGSARSHPCGGRLRIHVRHQAGAGQSRASAGNRHPGPERSVPIDSVLVTGASLPGKLRARHPRQPGCRP